VTHNAQLLILATVYNMYVQQARVK